MAVTWLIFRTLGVQLDELRALEPGGWRPDPVLLALASAVLLAGYLMSAAIWGWMVGAMGGGRLPVGAAVGTFLVANLGRYVPGKVWQIAGLALLARRRGVPATVATGAAVLGQGVALVAATLVGAVALRELGGRGSAAALAVLVGGLLMVGVASVPPVFRRLTALWFQVARTEPPEETPGPGVVLACLGLYVVNWMVYALAFWILAQSFGLPGGVLEVAPAFAAAYVVGYVAVFAPAGLGVREGILTLLLAPVMGQGAAVALSVVARVWATVVEVVPAGALWLRHLQAGEGREEGRGP